MHIVIFMKYFLVKVIKFSQIFSDLPHDRLISLPCGEMDPMRHCVNSVKRGNQNKKILKYLECILKQPVNWRSIAEL